MIGWYERTKWNEMSKCGNGMKGDEKINGNVIKWGVTNEGWLKAKMEWNEIVWDSKAMRWSVNFWDSKAMKWMDEMEKWKEMEERKCG